MSLWADFDDEGGAGEPGRSLVSSPVAWGVLLAVYVVFGLLVKSFVLNWIVGPLFPLFFLYLLPRFLRGRPTT